MILAMDKLKNICAYLPTIGLLLVFIALPYRYGAFQRTALYIAGIGFLIDYAVNCRWRQWTWGKDKWAYVVFILFYLCLPLRQCMAGPGDWLFHTKIESYLPFLIFGITGLMGGNRTMKLEYVAIALLLGCLSMAVVLSKGMWGVPLTPFEQWHNQLNMQRIMLINSHMIVNVYCNITLVFGLWLLTRSSVARWLKITVAVMMLGVVVGIMLSEGRIGQITMMLVFLCFVVYRLIQTHWRQWILPSLVGLALVAGVMWHLNPHYHDYSLHDNPRIYVWQVATSVIMDKPILGWGASAARSEFIQRGQNDENFCTHYMAEYEAGSQYLYGTVNYQIMHPHSAFLEACMESGIIGLVLLILCMLFPFLCLPTPDQRWFMGMCVLVYATPALVECFGIGLTPMWVPLLTFVWTYNASSVIPPTSPAHP